MRSVRLSGLLEQEGRLPVDEAAALAWRLLSEAPARNAPGVVSPVGVLLRSDGSAGVVSPVSQRVFLGTASAFEQELCGPLRAWAPAEPGAVQRFDDGARFRFGVLSILFACVTGRRPFEVAPPPGTSGSDAFQSLVSHMGDRFPDGLARLLRTELLWHLEPSPGARHWLKKPLSPEVVHTTLLEFVGEHGPHDTLSALGLRVEAVVSRRPISSVIALTASVRGGDDGARQVLADAYEERGQLDEAEWLRLESALQDRPGRRETKLLKRLAELRARLPSRFIAEVSRASIDRCQVRFGLKCPRRWDELERTEDPERRFCTMCDSPVFFVQSVDAARQAARAGQCIALAPAPEGESDERVIEMGMPVLPEWDDPDD